MTTIITAHLIWPAKLCSFPFIHFCTQTFIELLLYARNLQDIWDKKLISLQEVQSSLGEADRQIVNYVHHMLFFLSLGTRMSWPSVVTFGKKKNKTNSNFWFLWAFTVYTRSVQDTLKCRWWYHSHFTEEDIEAHRAWAICPTSYSWFRPRKSSCRVHALNHHINCLFLIDFTEEKERTLRVRENGRSVHPAIMASLLWSIRFIIIIFFF